MMHTKIDYQKWYDQREKTSLEEFFTYLRFPSISAQSQHRKSLLECAKWVEAYLNDMGFTTERWEGEGHPIIFAQRLVDPSAPTLLFYGHYDVQPPEPFDLWKSPPFEPEIRNGRIYARGAEDNKGQNYYTMLAIKAFLEKNPHAKINLKYIIEGEEEMGSNLLEELAPTKQKELAADTLLIVDTGMGSRENPGLEIGCRGIMTMDITLTNTNTDLHSGSYGGIVYNPNRALAEILASLIDEQGHINIPHLYDDVVPLSDEERQVIDTSFDEQALKQEVGQCALHVEEGFTPTEANWLRPTLEINGMWGGYTGEGFKTVIPSEAHAKISCRLVPNQDPKKIYQYICDAIRKRLPNGMQADFIPHGGGTAAWSSPSAKSTQVLKQAFEDVFGSCAIIYGGGSIPITALLAKHSGAELVLPGVGLPCDRIHAPNENFGLDQLAAGFLIIATTLERVAAVD